MRFTVPFNPVSAARPNWSTKSGQATRTYMPHKYAAFRRKFAIWFEQWLKDTDAQLLRELYRLPDGRPIRDEDGQLSLDFRGYEITVVFYVETSNADVRPFPLTAQSSDIDNYYKAVTDGIFESDSFKNLAKLNDRWIQKVSMAKVACPKGEGKIVVDLKQLQI